MRTNEAPGAVSEQIRCITSCCGCEQHQTNEQQKPILPHPPPDEPKVCSVGQVEEALMQFGPNTDTTKSQPVCEKSTGALRTFHQLRTIFCHAASVGTLWGFSCLQGIQSLSRSSWSTRAAHQPHKKSLLASQSADQVRSVGAAWQHGL